MLGNKFTLFLVLFCAVFAVELLAGKCRPPCRIRYKCSDLEEVVWATDGKSCFVFRNGCHLRNENCNRRNNGLKALKVVSKEECQKLCSNACTKEYRPVCGIYNGNTTTFSNLCMMTNYICASGETYTLYSNSTCDSAEWDSI